MSRIYGSGSSVPSAAPKLVWYDGMMVLGACDVYEEATPPRKIDQVCHMYRLCPEEAVHASLYEPIDAGHFMRSCPQPPALQQLEFSTASHYVSATS
jgi:hypothetical protein